MAVLYYLYQNNRKGFVHRGQYYARVKPVGTRTLKDIADVVQRNASVKRSDVMAVLTELADVMNDMLSDGYRVKIDGFGSFKVGIRSAGADSAKDFSASKHIKSSRIVFQPDKLRKGKANGGERYLANTLEFMEIEKPVKKNEEEETP